MPCLRVYVTRKPTANVAWYTIKRMNPDESERIFAITGSCQGTCKRAMFHKIKQQNMMNLPNDIFYLHQKNPNPTTVTVTISYTNRLNEGNLTSLVALFNVQNFAHQIITHDQKRSSEKWCVKKENRITSRPKGKNRLFNLDNFKATLEINANRKYVQLCKIDITKNRVLYTTQYTW